MSPTRSATLYLTFEVGGQQYAAAAEAVEKIVPMAHLDLPPNAPKILAGFLNLAGSLVPVLKTRELFGAPDFETTLWTPLIVLAGDSFRFALQAESVRSVRPIAAEAVSPFGPVHTLNDYVTGIARTAEETLLIISPERLLLQQEERAIDEIRRLAEERIESSQGAPA